MANPGRVGFGIIGAGTVARVHAAAISSMRDCTVVAVADVNVPAAKRLAEQFNVQHVYEDYREMLGLFSTNAVAVCTPNHLHAEHAIEAARHGKHVLVEKPMARTPAEADTIIEACRASGVKLGCVSQNRFSKLSSDLSALVRSGDLGRPVMAKVSVDWYRTQQYFDGAAWRASRERAGGGVLMVQAIHCLDLLLWLMGPVETVIGAGAGTLSHTAGVEDTAVAVLRFESGAFGVVEATLSSYPESPASIEIVGTEGKARWEDDFLGGKKRLTVWTRAGERVSETRVILPEAPGVSADEKAANPSAFQSSEDHRLQIEDFVDAIRSDREPKVGGADGRRVLCLIRDIYESAGLLGARPA